MPHWCVCSGIRCGPTLVSLAVSLLMVLPALLLMRVPTPQLTAVAPGTLVGVAGGRGGCGLYHGSTDPDTTLGRRAGFIVCVIAGQVLSSLAIDQWGLMGLPVKPVNGLRVFGVGLIVAGMVVVQWGTSASR